MKDAYKELRKKLNDHFEKPQGNNYAIGSSVGVWVKQCGIKPHKFHTEIICTIFGSVPYPYQQQDRKTILKFLKKNKYKDYKLKQKAKVKTHKECMDSFFKEQKEKSKKAKKEGRLSI